MWLVRFFIEVECVDRSIPVASSPLFFWDRLCKQGDKIRNASNWKVFDEFFVHFTIVRFVNPYRSNDFVTQVRLLLQKRNKISHRAVLGNEYIEDFL